MEEKKPQEEKQSIGISFAGVPIGIGAGFALGIALNDAIQGLIMGAGLALFFSLAIGQLKKRTKKTEQ